MLRRLHLACFSVLIGMGTVPALGAPPASVSGVVRDSAGAPQIGAVVELLRPDLTVVTSTYTNVKGRFSFSAVLPGRYAVKAMGMSFLPSLRENVRVRSGTVVNLTLNSLYEVMQWLPAAPRAGNGQKDDWAWTLRSAANRPLLRWLEDGPLLVVSDGPRSTPKLKARLIAAGQEGTFGEDGQRISIELEDTPSDSRELLARVDFDPRSNAGMESMLGFRQELGFAGSVQSMAAVALHPEIGGAGGEGLDEAAMRTWQTINLGDEFEAEAGNEQVVARVAQGGSNTVIAALPFLTVGWRAANSTLHYRLDTAVPEEPIENDAEAAAWLPALSVRNGSLALEHGMHQEIGWERRTDASSVAVLLYADSIVNPALEAMGRFAATGVPQGALYDAAGGLMRTAGPAFSSTGLVAAVEHRLPRGNAIEAMYANGDALVMAASDRPMLLSQMVAMARPRAAQMYSISLSGTLDGTGTRWRASYRWQPEDTVTRVAPFALEAADPYFNLSLRQTIYGHREGARSLNAMIEMRNLLGQGEHSFVLTDGSLLMFAQDQRGVSAGLAFTF